MATHIPFTDNYQDLSTDRGFQFRFNCERCGNGHMSSFQPSAVGMAGDAIRAASNLFGGVFGRAAETATDVQRMVGGPAHDNALRKAVEEISPLFHQCGRCGTWVCGDICWNDVRNQCAHCSPKMDQEVSAIESEATVMLLRQKAMAQAELVSDIALTPVKTQLQCPACNADVPASQKFCGECGTNVYAKPKCSSCGLESAPGTKFCGECGTKL